MATNRLDLTTVAAVEAWLNQGGTVDATLIQSIITSYSQFALTYTSRAYLGGVATYSERYNGNGSSEMLLRNYPILSVASLSVDGVAIPASPDYVQAGFVIDTTGSGAGLAILAGGSCDTGNTVGWSNWSVIPGSGYGTAGLGQPSLRGQRFNQGIQNVAVTYTAGYTEPTTESPTIPASSPYTATVSQAATFYADEGVVVGGAVLAAVASSPGPGEYSVSAAGVYTFNAAQAGQSAMIAYSYGATPYDLSQALAEWCAAAYKRRQWIEQVSQVQPGIGTTSYSRLPMPPQVQSVVDRYRRKFLD